MKQTLKNDILTVEIDSFGAEIQSIRANRSGYEYTGLHFRESIFCWMAGSLRIYNLNNSKNS